MQFSVFFLQALLPLPSNCQCSGKKKKNKNNINTKFYIELLGITCCFYEKKVHIYSCAFLVVKT